MKTLIILSILTVKASGGTANKLEEQVSAKSVNSKVFTFTPAGVPGRHEIDDTQELFYPAIMKVIWATGFKEYVAQEFIPTGKTNEEKEKALKKAIKICDI